MGDGEKASLRLQFNPKVRLAFHGATITTDRVGTTLRRAQGERYFPFMVSPSNHSSGYPD